VLETPKDLHTPVLFINHSNKDKDITMDNQQETKNLFLIN
jgi:hypothetical protein